MKILIATVKCSMCRKPGDVFQVGEQRQSWPAGWATFSYQLPNAPVTNGTLCDGCQIVLTALTRVPVPDEPESVSA